MDGRQHCLKLQADQFWEEYDRKIKEMAEAEEREDREWEEELANIRKGNIKAVKDSSLSVKT